MEMIPLKYPIRRHQNPLKSCFSSFLTHPVFDKTHSHQNLEVKAYFDHPNRYSFILLCFVSALSLTVYVDEILYS